MSPTQALVQPSVPPGPDVAAPPPVRPRPLFALYMFLRGLQPRDCENQLGSSYESIRRYTLPFDDENFRVSPEWFRARVESWTGGEVPASSWEPAGAGVEQVRRLLGAPA